MLINTTAKYKTVATSLFGSCSRTLLVDKITRMQNKTSLTGSLMTFLYRWIQITTN